MHSTQCQLKCANPDKSEKAKKRMQEIADKELQKLDFNKSNYQPPPNEKVVSKVIGIHVKLVHFMSCR